MASYVTPEGMLGYVQPIGAGPGNAWPDKTEVYGHNQPELSLIRRLATLVAD